MYIGGTGSYGGGAVSFEQYFVSWQSGSWGGGDVIFSDGTIGYQAPAVVDPMYYGVIPDVIVHYYSDKDIASMLVRYNTWFVNGMLLNPSGSWCFDDFMVADGSGSIGGSGNGGGAYPSPGKPIELMDASKFVPWSTSGDCMSGSVAILANYGVKSDNTKTVTMVTEDRTLTKKGELDNTDAYMQGITFIDKELDAGNPLIVGVDVRTDKNPNPGSASDHFVVITGRGYDKDGNAYYTYMETATSNPSDSCSTTENRFYYNPGTSRWEDSTNTYSHTTMTITDVRPNKK